MKYLFTTTLLFFSLLTFSQRQYAPKKISHNKGALYGSWGYNRTFYSKSKFKMKGEGYDYSLKKVKASDRPVPFSLGKYFSKESFLSPQFSASLGYYVVNNWAVTFEANHYKYVVNDNNNIVFNGQASDAVPVNFGDGNLIPIGKNEDINIVTNKDDFHYENTNGLNFFAFGLTRTDRFFDFGLKSQFVVSSNLAASLGFIQTVNDFKFAGQNSFQTSSISGFGLKAALGVRLEFFRHFFIQSNFSGGYVNTPKVRTRPKSIDPNAFNSQQFGYIGLDICGGVLFYINE